MNKDQMREKLAENIRRKLLPGLCRELSVIIGRLVSPSDFISLSETSLIMSQERRNELVIDKTVSKSELADVAKWIVSHAPKECGNDLYLQLPQFSDVGLLAVKLNDLMDNLIGLINSYEMIVAYNIDKSCGLLFNEENYGVEIEIWGKYSNSSGSLLSRVQK